jgi:hypothetical protein
MTEAERAAALLRPEGPPSRFAIHRNNVTQNLIAALEAGFPVTRRLLGEAFFAATALTFLRRHPPRSPLLMLYGADFPDFLRRFQPAQPFPYLPDVAALEQALRESYHAADAPPIATETLALITEAHRLTLAPSLRLVRSDWPIWSIWTTKGEVPLPATQGTDVVILRPGFDPQPHPLPPGGGRFLAALLAGQTLRQALSAAPSDFDLTAVLTLLLRGDGLVSLTL